MTSDNNDYTALRSKNCKIINAYSNVIISLSLTDIITVIYIKAYYDVKACFHSARAISQKKFDAVN